MTFRRFLFPLLFAAALPATAQRSIEAALDSTRILIGSQTTLLLTVRAPEGVAVVFPDYEPKSTLSKGVEVVSVQGIDTTASISGTVELRRGYVLTSFDSAHYRFAPPPVIIGGDTVRSGDSLTLSVASVPVDTLHLDQFYGAKDVAAEDFRLNWLLLAVAVGFVLLSALSYWLIRRWRNVKRRTLRRVITLPPTEDQVALSEISTLRAEIYNADDPAMVYDRLIATLRTYIAARLHIDTSLLTSPQLLEALRTTPAAEALDKLHVALSASDIVRFANQRSDARRDEPFTAAAAFVDAIKAPPRASDTEEREEAEPLAAYRRRKNAWLVAAAFSTLATIAAVLWLVNEITALI